MTMTRPCVPSSLPDRRPAASPAWRCGSPSTSAASSSMPTACRSIASCASSRRARAGGRGARPARALRLRAGRRELLGGPLCGGRRAACSTRRAARGPPPDHRRRHRPLLQGAAPRVCRRSRRSPTTCAPTGAARPQRWAPAHLHGVLASARSGDGARACASGDTQRIVRALEVLDATGMSLAEWQRLPRRAGAGCRRHRSRLLVAIGARRARRARIDARFRADDASRAGSKRCCNSWRSSSTRRLPVMTALGVRAAARAPRRRAVSSRRRSRLAKAETRQYAKRQVTWARSNMIAWTSRISARNGNISRRFRYLLFSRASLTLQHLGLRFRAQRTRPGGRAAAALNSVEWAMARTMTGAEMVLAALDDQGVEHIFGYPGGAVLPIYDELFQQDKIRHILVRQEGGALHAAEGYARSTGKVGVVLVTSGPGATNCGDRPHRRADGFDPARVHHRPGADAPDRQRRVPGVRHGRHHPPVHQAQLAGEERQRPGAHPARGVLHRQGRPPRPGRGRHPQGHPVRHRQLRRSRRTSRTRPTSRA